MSVLVPIDSKLIGMKLDRSIMNKFGQVLLPSDLELAERHIELLNTWGVKSVWIHKDEISGNSSLDEEKVKELKESLSKRLEWKPRNSWESELYTLAFQTLIRSQSQKS